MIAPMATPALAGMVAAVSFLATLCAFPRDRNVVCEVR